MSDGGEREKGVPELGTVRIGSRILESPFFLAPLAGYTQLPFRLTIRELGGIGLATTDLVHAGHLLAGSRKSRENIATSNDDRPLSVQLFGRNADEVADAAAMLEDEGYEGIDLNMGCPMGKVNSGGGGARLLCDRDAAQQLVATVVSAVSLPVTVKMRLGWDQQSLAAPELAAIFEQEGVAGITIHGRTRQQGFHGQVDLDGIRRTVAAVRAIPVIGNGDVRTIDEARRMFAETGCSAIAIGRGALLDPWLFRNLKRELLEGCPPGPPSHAERLAFLENHFRRMQELFGDRACLLIRKFAAWYGARCRLPSDLEDRLRRIASPEDMRLLLLEAADRPADRPLSETTALIKTPNGPQEHW